MTWIEQILLNKRREVIVTFCPAATITSINANAQRVAIRVLWNNPGAIEIAAGAQQTLVRVNGKNNSGGAYNQEIMGISKNKQIDELHAEVFGYLVQSQLLIDNQSAISDCELVEVLLR